MTTCSSAAASTKLLCVCGGVGVSLGRSLGDGLFSLLLGLGLDDRLLGGVDLELRLGLGHLDGRDSILVALEATPVAGQLEDRGDLLGRLLSSLARERGQSKPDLRLAIIGLTALLDGLWLEWCLDPGSFRPKEAAMLCDDWVDRVIGTKTAP